MRCCRNLTLVYINWLMVKLVLLCVFHLKSQNLGTMLSEDINSTPLTDIASHWRTLGLGAGSIQSRLSRVFTFQGIFLPLRLYHSKLVPKAGECGTTKATEAYYVRFNVFLVFS